MKNKFVRLDVLLKAIEERRTVGAKVVFTNGCFDILHAGHVSYLSAARDSGDLLVIGLNSDASVHSIKGDRRPIIDQAHRAEVLSSMACVDFVVLFDEPDPERLIHAVRPDVLAKGADWAEEDIIGAGFVRSYGGDVARIELSPDISTSIIIERIVDKYCC